MTVPGSPALGAERSLDSCGIGTRSVLRRVVADRDRRRRLAELGFVPGARIEVISRGGIGGLVLAVNSDGRVAIDATGARQLTVQVEVEVQ